MADWWAVGITIYELLCKKAPHDFDDMYEDKN